MRMSLCVSQLESCQQQQQHLIAICRMLAVVGEEGSAALSPDDQLRHDLIITDLGSCGCRVTRADGLPGALTSSFLAGSLPYMSPEMLAIAAGEMSGKLSNVSYDQTLDIWSAACIYGEMLTGKVRLLPWHWHLGSLPFAEGNQVNGLTIYIFLWGFLAPCPSAVTVCICHCRELYFDLSCGTRPVMDCKHWLC